MSDTKRVVKVVQLEAALLAEMKETYDQPKLEAMGAFMRGIIVDRTAEGLDADGNAFEPYSTTPLYIPLSARPVPRGGIKTPQPRSTGGAVAFDIFGFTSKRKKAKKAKAKYVVDYNPYTFEGKRRKAAGKSMFFPFGWMQYKANIGATVVNLMCSGRMLGSMFSSVSGAVIRIAFRGNEANDKALGNDASRNFFGLMRIPKEVERVQAYWKVLNGQ